MDSLSVEKKAKDCLDYVVRDVLKYPNGCLMLKNKQKQCVQCIQRSGTCKTCTNLTPNENF